MFDQLDDTIVAISSPPGMSLRGIIRLSGPCAFALAAEVFDGVSAELLAEAPGHRCIPGRIIVDEFASVPAEAYTFRAPASYTRQDVVELHMIGSPPLLSMVLERLTEQGARPAEPGEFTARAFFHGAMDLTRVEGVAAIIHAHNDSQLRASEALLHGRLSKLSTELRERLADLLALIEAEIDFTEEPIDFVSAAQAVETIGRVMEELKVLLDNSPSVERLDVLPQVILAGQPNAGKSTLFNRLTGMDRAIQSATAGTTRDVISAPMSVPGGEIMLLDSAGLIDMCASPIDDQLSDPAMLAESRSRRFLASADLILLVVDISCEPEQVIVTLFPQLPNVPVRIIANKTDLVSQEQLHEFAGKISRHDGIVFTSAISDCGIDVIKDEISHLLFSQMPSHGADLLALSNRQRRSLNDAYDSLGRAHDICDQSSDISEHAELLALELRGAINALSLLVGEVTTDDLLGRIFSQFCIGK